MKQAFSSWRNRLQRSFRGCSGGRIRDQDQVEYEQKQKQRGCAGQGAGDGDGDGDGDGNGTEGVLARGVGEGVLGVVQRPGVCGRSVDKDKDEDEDVSEAQDGSERLQAQRRFRVKRRGLERDKNHKQSGAELYHKCLGNRESVASLGNADPSSATVGRASPVGVLRAGEHSAGGQVAPGVVQSVEVLSVDTSTAVAERGRRRKWATWADSVRSGWKGLCCRRKGSGAPLHVPVGATGVGKPLPWLRNGAEDLDGLAEAEVPGRGEPAAAAHGQRMNLVQEEGELEGAQGLLGRLAEAGSRGEPGFNLEENSAVQGAEDLLLAPSHSPQGASEAGPGPRTAAFRDQRSLQGDEDEESFDSAEYLQNDTGTVLRIRPRRRRRRTGAERREWRQNLVDAFARVPQPEPEVVDAGHGDAEQMLGSRQAAATAQVGMPTSLDDVLAGTPPGQNGDAAMKDDTDAAPRDLGGLQPSVWLAGSLRNPSLADLPHPSEEDPPYVRSVLADVRRDSGPQAQAQQTHGEVLSSSRSTHPVPVRDVNGDVNGDSDPALEALQTRARNVSQRLSLKLRQAASNETMDGPSVLDTDKTVDTSSPSSTSTAMNPERWRSPTPRTRLSTSRGAFVEQVECPGNRGRLVLSAAAGPSTTPTHAGPGRRRFRIRAPGWQTNGASPRFSGRGEETGLHADGPGDAGEHLQLVEAARADAQTGCASLEVVRTIGDYQ